MDDFLEVRVKNFNPQINPLIAHGLAVEHTKQTVEYIDSVLKGVAKNFPPGLTYEGCERCTPEDEFNIATAKKNSKRMFDLAVSNVFLVRLHYKLEGVPMKPRYVYLPYVDKAGGIKMNSNQYFVWPMLSDSTFSPSEKGVFMGLLRDKLNFERVAHHILIDGIPETIQITHSTIYHRSQAKKKEQKPLIKANCAMAHYMFCKFGVTVTFRRYGACQPVIGLNTEITEDQYPSSDWVICSSRNMKPAGNGKMKYFGNSNLRVAIAKDKFTDIVRSLVGGFFYVVDHFPDQMRKDWIDRPAQWQVLLGQILFGQTLNVGKALEDIGDHLSSLEEYIDSIIAEKLKLDGYYCEDIYDLFNIVMVNINNWVVASDKTINSMYDKELTILYRLLYNVTFSIFKMHFKLKSAAKKGLKERDIDTIMTTQFRPRAIYGITHNHPTVGMESYSGDNEFFGITTKLISQQNNSNQGSKKERKSPNDPSKTLHVSVAEIGGFSNMPKNEPCGRWMINPHCVTDVHGRIKRNESMIPLLTKVENMITAKPTVT